MQPGVPIPIDQVLHRRTDMATFLVHLTGPTADTSARDNLLTILEANLIEARTPFGMARESTAPGVIDTQKVVCLSETPLEQVWSLCANIADRSTTMSKYGLVFPKLWARSKGCNPILYIDMSYGEHEWLVRPINAMVRLAELGLAQDVDAAGHPYPVNAADAPIMKITPFLEQMFTWAGGRQKEFWWEREWRHRGPLTFEWNNILAVLAPAADHDTFRTALAGRINPDPSAGSLRFLDPDWGMERMIAALAGLSERDVNPFA